MAGGECQSIMCARPTNTMCKLLNICPNRTTPRRQRGGGVQPAMHGARTDAATVGAEKGPVGTQTGCREGAVGCGHQTVKRWTSWRPQPFAPPNLYRRALPHSCQCYSVTAPAARSEEIHVHLLPSPPGYLRHDTAPLHDNAPYMAQTARASHVLGGCR